MKRKGHYVLLSFVCVVLGFIGAYSYSLTAKQERHDLAWDRQYELRSKLIAQEEENAELKKRAAALQQKVRQEERQLADQQADLSEAVEEAEYLRMYLGKVKVKGEGVEITLSDSLKSPADSNVNHYLVHDVHIHAVLNELYAAGANAIAVNGTRLTAHSSVTCTGPVVSVNGENHPAPFIITAIGDADVLNKAMNIRGGVIDQLVADNISVKMQVKQNVVLEPYYER